MAAAVAAADTHFQTGARNHVRPDIRLVLQSATRSPLHVPRASCGAAIVPYIRQAPRSPPHVPQLDRVQGALSPAGSFWRQKLARAVPPDARWPPHCQSTRSWFTTFHNSSLETSHPARCRLPRPFISQFEFRNTGSWHGPPRRPAPQRSTAVQNQASVRQAPRRNTRSVRHAAPARGAAGMPHVQLDCPGHPPACSPSIPNESLRGVC